MLRTIILGMGLLLLVGGCTRGIHRGTVAMTLNDQEGQVSLGDTEVEAGDRVGLYKNECRFDLRLLPGCIKVKMGLGTINQTLNAHFSTLKADPKVSLREGMIVEKE